jgi:hypothetical protein
LINKEIENNGNEKDSFKDSLVNLEKLVISKEKMEWLQNYKEKVIKDLKES